MHDNGLSATNPSMPGIRLEQGGTYRVDCAKWIGGKRVHIYSSGYLTVEDAIAARDSLIGQKLEEERKRQEVNMLFPSFYERYEKYRLLHVRVSSVHFGRSVVHSCCAKWENCLLSEAFLPSSIKEVYEGILDSYSTAAWKNRCFGVIRQMIETAWRWRLIPDSSHQQDMAILENIPENRGAKKERDFWTKRERERFLNAIDDPNDSLLFALLIALGARIGEFTGLTWDCYNQKEGTIEIRQQLVYEDKRKWVLSNQLKTSESYRVCRLSKELNRRLMEYKSRSGGKGFLFRSSLNPNNPLSKASIRRKMYAYAKKAGLRKVTPHALRHGRAMDLMGVCKNMQEVKAAARYLGHSATMMIDTYGHGDDLATNAVIKRLEKEEE